MNQLQVRSMEYEVGSPCVSYEVIFSEKSGALQQGSPIKKKKPRVVQNECPTHAKDVTKS